jgi:hypothetical protein
VPVNPNTASDPASADSRIDHPAAAAWARLFNLRYRVLLAELFLTLSESMGENTGADGSAARDQLALRALHREMNNPMGIKGLAAKLVQLPLHPPAAGLTAQRAAPPFELPGDRLPTTPQAQQQMLLGLIDAAAQAIDAVLALPGDDAPSTSDQAKLKNLKASDAAFRQAVAAKQFTEPPL